MTPTEHRDALAYVGLPLDVTMDQLTRMIGETFDKVAGMLSANGIAPRGAIIRYTAARPDGTFDVEVGHLVDAAEMEGTPIEPDELPAGAYSVVRHDGPYAELGRVTAELMASWEEAGVSPAMAHPTRGDDYACWYEHYLDMPRQGPAGPEGAVEICVLTAP